jgi:hypothetical protein
MSFLLPPCLLNIVDDYLEQKDSIRVRLPYLIHSSKVDIVLSVHKIVFDIKQAKCINYEQARIIIWLFDNYFSTLQSEKYKMRESSIDYYHNIYILEVDRLYRKTSDPFTLQFALYSIVSNYIKNTPTELTEILINKVCTSIDELFFAHYLNFRHFKDPMVFKALLRKNPIQPIQCRIYDNLNIDTPKHDKPQTLLELVCLYGTIEYLEFLHNTHIELFERATFYDVPYCLVEECYFDGSLEIYDNKRITKEIKVNDEIAVQIDIKRRDKVVFNTSSLLKRMYDLSLIVYRRYYVDMDIVKFMIEKRYILPFNLVLLLHNGDCYTNILGSVYNSEQSYNTIRNLVDYLQFIGINGDLANRIKNGKDVKLSISKLIRRYFTIEEIEQIPFITSIVNVWNISEELNGYCLEITVNTRDPRVFYKCVDVCNLNYCKRLLEILIKMLYVHCCKIDTLEKIAYIRKTHRLEKINDSTEFCMIHSAADREKTVMDLDKAAKIIELIRENFDEDTFNQFINRNFREYLHVLQLKIELNYEFQERKQMYIILKYLTTVKIDVLEQFLIERPTYLHYNINNLVIVYSLGVLSYDKLLDIVSERFMKYLEIDQKIWTTVSQIEEVSQWFISNMESVEDYKFVENYEEEAKLMNRLVSTNRIKFPLKSKKLLDKVFSYYLTHSTFIIHLRRECDHRSILWAAWYENFKGELPRPVYEEALNIIERIHNNEKKKLRFIEKLGAFKVV